MSNQHARKSQTVDLFIDCVFLSSLPCEFTFLRNILGVAGIRLHHAESLEQADFLLTVTESTVLLTDLVFADGTWHDAVEVLGARHPLAPVLLAADPIDRPLLGDLFDRGACGVIWKPFEFETSRKLIRAVHEASKERQILREEVLSRPA
jgi:DNA-binding NtrC family response regulator